MTNHEAVEILTYMKNAYSKKPNWALDMAIQSLKERPQGEWITFPTNHSIIQCPECTALINNLRVDVFKDKVGKMNFCPNCGAKMRTEAD